MFAFADSGHWVTVTGWGRGSRRCVRFRPKADIGDLSFLVWGNAFEIRDMPEAQQDLEKRLLAAALYELRVQFLDILGKTTRLLAPLPDLHTRFTTKPWRFFPARGLMCMPLSMRLTNGSPSSARSI